MNLIAEIEAVRSKIAATRERIETLRNANVPRAVALERIDALIAERGQRFADRVLVEPLLAPDYSGDFDRMVDDTWSPGPGGYVSLGAVDEALCALVPDAMRAFLVGKVDALLAASPAVKMPRDRDAEIERLQDELLRLERQEVGLVDRAEAEGLPVKRRRGVDPRALLGLEG